MIEDPGLQPQRTTLAWTRTAIGCGGLTAILIRHAVVTGRVVDMAGATLAGAMTVLMLVLGRRRRDRIRANLEAHHSPVVPRSVVVVTALMSTVALAVIAGILATGVK